MLTAKVQYALVLLQDIAQNQSGRPVKIKEVANRNLLNEKFLQQVARLLRIKGLIRSVRGPGGGCVASQDLSTLSLLDVMHAVEAAKTLKVAVQSPEGAKLPIARHSEVIAAVGQIKALSCAD
jgi:Rrf2 family protein